MSKTYCQESRKVIYKTIIAGDDGVGKTSFIDLLGDGLSAAPYRPRDYTMCNITQIPGLKNDVGVNITDLKCDRTMMECEFSAVKVAFVMCDVTNMDSFETLGTWIESFKSHIERFEETPVIVIAHKCDLVDKRVVTYDHLKEFTMKYNGVEFIETAINRFGPDNTFMYPHKDFHRCIDFYPPSQVESLYSIFISFITDRFLWRSQTAGWKQLPFPIQTPFMAYPHCKTILPLSNRPQNTTAYPVLKQILKNNLIRRKIWYLVSMIHKTLGGVNLKKFNQLNIKDLIVNRNVNEIGWHSIYLLVKPMTEPKFDSETVFKIFRYCPVKESRILTLLINISPDLALSGVRVMDELCVSGNLEVFKMLYSKDVNFRCSERGLRLAIQFGHLKLVQFIMGKLKRVETRTKSKKDYDRDRTDEERVTFKALTEMSNETKNVCKTIARDYNRSEIIASIKAGLFSKLFSKLNK